MASLPTPWLQRVLPLFARRVVAVDPGSRSLKIVVADRSLGRIHFVRRDSVDLNAESLVTPEEIHEHLRAAYPELAGLPLALVLGQNRCINQVVDLPEVRGPELRLRLRDEAARVSGLPADSLSCESARLRPYAHYQRPFWLTLCKTREVDVLIDRFGTPFAEAGDDAALPPVVDVVTTAHALLASAHHSRLPGETAALIDLGANSTTVVLQVRGQGVFATSLGRGWASFTAALARATEIAPNSAEQRRRAENLLTGPAADPAVAKAVDTWAAELRLAVSEWIEDHAALGVNLNTLPAWIGGGGAVQEGLVEYLNTLGGLRFQRWPSAPPAGSTAPDTDFVVAEGAALHALGHVRHRVSLLPAQYRAGVHRQFAWELMQLAILVLLLVLTGSLTFGIWRQAELLEAKQRLTVSAGDSLRQAQQIDARFEQINKQYERLRPAFQRQRETVQLLGALGAAERSRTNDAFWYVLFADAASYAAGTTLPEPATNRPAAVALPLPAAAGVTNRREFIAEICVPSEGEVMRATLSQVVSNLSASHVFTRVDALPPERKKALVDPRVVITNRWFGLSMELPAEELPAPLRLVRDRTAPAASTTNAGAPRRVALGVGRTNGATANSIAPR